MKLMVWAHTIDKKKIIIIKPDPATEESVNKSELYITD